ncbi:glycosyl transferase family 2 [Dietzia psychralcaliphila]|nr:glycosyl transferase family 2 [Dietzia psychralcaliphila]
MTDPMTPAGGVPSARTLVIVPTYDERENLPDVVERLLVADPDVAVLVADDNSPDGTGEVADQLAAGDTRRRISVLHREGKQGLGAAYIAGLPMGPRPRLHRAGRDGR